MIAELGAWMCAYDSPVIEKVPGSTPVTFTPIGTLKSLEHASSVTSCSTTERRSPEVSPEPFRLVNFFC